MKIKKFSTHTSLPLLIALSVVLSLPSCVDPYYYPPKLPDTTNAGNNGLEFKNDLVQAIEASSRIVVLQHSHSSDFEDITLNTNDTPYYGYGSRILSSFAKEDFLRRVRNLGDYNSVTNNTPFKPHHTIKFYSQGLLKSTMLISLQTNQVRWNGSRSKAPQNIMRVLDPVITNAGFETSRDWKGLAKIEYSNGGGTANGSGDEAADSHSSDPSESRPNSKPKPKPSTTGTPTAKPVPGKPGMVFNPFTGNQVDVGGIPSGTKVRDPKDNDQSHIFRVP